MDKDRVHALAKNRVTQIRMTEVCNKTLIGVFTVWLVWAATSVLIRLIR